MLNKTDKKTNPFKVPENYFENFNTQIMDQLPVKEAEKAKIVPLWKKIVPWTAVAAALLGVMVYAGSLFETKNNLGDPSQQLSSYTTVVVEDDMYQIMEDEVIASTYSDMMYNEMYAN